MKVLLVNVLITAMMAWPSAAFTVRQNHHSSTLSSRTETRLFLEDRIAKLIDEEIYRQGHKKEYEREWMEKNREHVLHSMHANDHSLMEQEDHVLNFRRYKKDKQMAANDPQRYCADRCIATGNCDVFEDFYHLSPAQVRDFCEECVLSDQGECDLPQDFYDVGKLMP